jgi:IrrE N-terminal-like domain
MLLPERKLKRDFVETEAFHVLKDYYGEAIKLPVDPELIGDKLGLSWVWGEIEDPEPGNPRKIFAGLYPGRKEVVMNEIHVDLFTSKPGFENFTKAHEVGHWILHVDRAAIDHPTLFEIEGDDPILCRAGDENWIERQADWFAAGLLMPQKLFLETVSHYPLGHRDVQRELASIFGVTISALVTRLRQFDLPHVTVDGDVVSSLAESRGQLRL